MLADWTFWWIRRGTLYDTCVLCCCFAFVLREVDVSPEKGHHYLHFSLFPFSYPENPNFTSVFFLFLLGGDGSDPDSLLRKWPGLIESELRKNTAYVLQTQDINQELRCHSFHQNQVTLWTMLTHQIPSRKQSRVSARRF